MVVTAASGSKKRLNLSTPQNTGVAERSVMSSTKTRGTSSQRRRGRRGRMTGQPQTPLSVRSIDDEHLATSAAGHGDASHHTLLLKHQCLMATAVLMFVSCLQCTQQFGHMRLILPTVESSARADWLRWFK